MSTKSTKRKKTIPDSPTSPPAHSAMDAAVNTIMAKLEAMTTQMTAHYSKIETLEAAVVGLRADLAASVQNNIKKDEIITKQQDQINTCEQSIRSSSLRILGLPLVKDSPASTILNTVFDLVVQPILEHAKLRGDLEGYPSRRFIIESAFCIPAKNPASCPVIVKLSSSFIRSLIFQYKNDVLPKSPDATTKRIRYTFAIYEDLTSANFAHMRTLSEDTRTTSIWTYNGQIKFRTKDTDNIYRVRSLTDTVDSILKTKPPRPTPP